MSGPLIVGYSSLEARADELETMAGQVAALIPEIAVYAARSGLHELVSYGLIGGLPVAADLVALCLPGTVGSLVDLSAELLTMAAAVRAAEATYVAVDGARWATAEVPTAAALLMLAAWDQLHDAQRLADSGPWPWQLAGVTLDRESNGVVERCDRWIEGAGKVGVVDPRTMPPLARAPARDLASLLGVVDTISDAAHPSTVALIHVGDQPPRYVLCLPGLQNAVGADSGAADLPGAIATLTGHSAYIRGMAQVLASLPADAQVLLVGHSQGGMVAEALAAERRAGEATIAGVVTAGSPLLATWQLPADPVPYLALQNDEDPVPRLGELAAGLAGAATADGPIPGRTLVRFRTPGSWPSITKHGLGSGGYLSEAASDDRRVAAFRHRMAAFFSAGRIDVTYLQVTDSDGTLPP